MTTFFQQTAQAIIAKHIDRFPLLKLDQVIDWQPIEQYPIGVPQSVPVQSKQSRCKPRHLKNDP